MVPRYQLEQTTARTKHLGSKKTHRSGKLTHSCIYAELSEKEMRLCIHLSKDAFICEVFSYSLKFPICKVDTAEKNVAQPLKEV